MKKINVNKATTDLYNKLNSLWPLEVKDNKESIDIEIGHETREIWAFPLVGGVEYIDDAIHSMEEHRKVIPAALNRCIHNISGAFLVGYYAKRINNDEYEHGLVIIPANRGSIEANSKVLTDYCFERDELYKNIFSEDYFLQVNSFLDSYKSVCRKYWIQDTKLINTNFIERPQIIADDDFEQKPATSTWNTEMYPDFMRPISMIGDIYIDFMICDHKLVYLQNDFDEEDSLWDFFEEEGIKEIYSLPANIVQNCSSNRINGWFETTDYEISERKDLEFNTIYDIAVPGLKGGIINEGYSIGWCGKIAFMGVGLDKSLYISPTLLKVISDIGDFGQVGNDNKAYWRNRDIDFRRKCKTHNLVKVCDDLMLEKEAKTKLVQASEVVLQSCKNPMKEVQKGITKYVIRYLKGLARGTEEKEAFELLNMINSAQICADVQEAIDLIMKWVNKVN